MTPLNRVRALWAAPWHPVAVMLACGLLAVVATRSWHVAWLTHLDEVADARAVVTSQLDRVRGDLSRELFASLNRADGLVTLVRLRGRIEPVEFDALAGGIVSGSPTVRNVGLAEGTTIRFIYPRAGNESALGVDYMGVPNQRAAVMQAIRERRTVVAGPLSLIQGGTGIIGRSPIYVRATTGPNAGTDVYWGIAATVISFDRLIDLAGLESARTGLKLALRGLDGTGARGAPFWGDAEAFRSEPVTLDVPLPSGSWVLAGVPKAGWPAFEVWRRPEFVAGVAASVALSLLLYSVLRVSRQRKLEVQARRRAEQELRAANEDRERMMAEVERGQRLSTLSVFAGGVAHDVNNLLAGLFGNIELARVALDPDHPSAVHLDTASTAFERARDLTRRLLTFAVGSAPERRPLAIEPFLHECCSLSMSGTAHPWSVIVEGGEPIRDVLGDANQLSQVFGNLLINARQAMAGEGRVRLHLRNRELAADSGVGLPAGHYVEVVVEDDGPGIAPDVMSRVFEPFFTTKANGSGLGLAMSYSIVSAHGGRITAGVASSGGAAFSLLLPGVEVPQPARTISAVVPEPSPSHGRILVMDDERLVRDMATRMLVRAGYDVVQAPDGGTAVERCREALEQGRPFDAAILDLTVPGGMGGREAFRVLRGLQPNLEVILSSGYGEVGAAAGECQPTAVLPKPYQMHELLACARAVVGGRSRLGA